jgi:hypothetical protein
VKSLRCWQRDLSTDHHKSFDRWKFKGHGAFNPWLSFTKKYGIARVEDACAAALEMEALVSSQPVEVYFRKHRLPLRAPLSCRSTVRPSPSNESEASIPR